MDAPVAEPVEESFVLSRGASDGDAPVGLGLGQVKRLGAVDEHRREGAPGKESASLDLTDVGHEIGLHGWIHEVNTAVPPDQERELHLRSADTLEKITGVRPVGMRTPSWDFSEVTLAVERELGLTYDSSLFADDDPYELVEKGEPTGMVELPVEWIRDDAVYFNMNRFQALRPYTSPEVVFDIFRREFDGAYAEGGLFLLTMHPHVITYRSRFWLLEELVRHAKAKGDVWFATHAQIAAYVKEQAGL